MRAIWIAVLAAALCLGAGLASALTLAETRAAARAAALSGDFPRAQALARDLLAADPQDPEGLLVMALLARLSGDAPASGEAAARAWAAAETPAQRYDAAMLAAGAASLQGRHGRAQLWLRRADQFAPSPKARDLVARTYAEAARRNPLRLRFSFSVRPSSNVNNGAETTEIEIGGVTFGLDDSGQELSGGEATAGLSLAWRLSEDRTHRTELLGEVFLREVWLSDDARAAAPGVSGSDFDQAAVIAGLRHSRLIWPGLGPTQVTGLVGKSWYGGDDYARWTELQFGQTVARGPDAAWRLGLTLRDENRLDDPVNDSVSVGLRADYQWRADGLRTALGASLRDIRSDSSTVDSLAFGLHASREFASLGGALPALSASAETRDYRDWIATPGGRRDDSLSLGLDLTWPEASWYGFVPRLSLDARRVWSNVDIYDRTRVSVGLTAVSRF